VFPRSVEVFVAIDPIDMSRRFGRLAGNVKAHVGRKGGVGLFVFFGERVLHERRDAIDGVGALTSRDPCRLPHLESRAGT
jgi:hypothetical protein